MKVDNAKEEQYRKQFQKIDSESLEVIREDRNKALEYAEKGIKISEPEKLTPEYIELVADSMQILARMILIERSSKES